MIIEGFYLKQVFKFEKQINKSFQLLFSFSEKMFEKALHKYKTSVRCDSKESDLKKQFLKFYRFTDPYVEESLIAR